MQTKKKAILLLTILDATRSRQLGGGHYTVLWTPNADVLQAVGAQLLGAVSPCPRLPAVPRLITSPTTHFLQEPPAIPTVPGRPLTASPAAQGGTEGHGFQPGQDAADLTDTLSGSDDPAAASAASALAALQRSGRAGDHQPLALPDDEDDDLQRALALSMLDTSASTVPVVPPTGAQPPSTSVSTTTTQTGIAAAHAPATQAAASAAPVTGDDDCNNGSDDELAAALAMSLQKTDRSAAAAHGTTERGEPGAKRWRDGSGGARPAVPIAGTAAAADDAALQRALQESMATYEEVRVENLRWWVSLQQCTNKRFHVVIQQQQQQGAAAAPATYGPITFYLYNGLRPPGRRYAQTESCIMPATRPAGLIPLFFPCAFLGAHQHAEVRVTPFDVFPFGGAPAREVSREEQERENVNLARRIKVRRACCQTPVQTLFHLLYKAAIKTFISYLL